MIFSLLFKLAVHTHNLQTAKNAQFAKSLLTFCNRFVINKPISGCVRMAFDSLSTLSLFQVVKLTFCMVMVKTCYPQACCKLFQQVDVLFVLSDLLQGFSNTSNTVMI